MKTGLVVEKTEFAHIPVWKEVVAEHNGIYYFTTTNKSAFHVYWSYEGDVIHSIDFVVKGKSYNFVGIPFDKMELVDIDELRSLLPDQIADLVVTAFNVQRMRL